MSYDDEFFKKLMSGNSSPILDNSAVVENAPAPKAPAPIPTPAPKIDVTPNQLTAAGLLGNTLQPRAADYQAPKIQIPETDPKIAKARAEQEKAILDKLTGLDTDYKKNMEDAEKRKLHSEIFAALGNYLPGVVAGATAMKTHASVHPAEMPKIVASDPTAGVQSKYKTDYENLLSQYKTMSKEGKGLTDKDRLYASIAQAQLDQGAKRVNSHIENTDRNANIQGAKLNLNDQNKNEMSDKQVGDITGFSKTHALLSDIENRLKTRKFDKFIGPYASTLENVKEKNPFSNGMDPEFAKFQSDVTDTLSQYIKSLSGLTVSDKEREALLTSAPKVGDKPQTFAAKLQATKDRLAQYEKIEKEHLAKYQGKNIEGYGVPKNSTSAQSSQPETKTLTDGTKYKKVPGGWQKVK